MSDEAISSESTEFWREYKAAADALSFDDRRTVDATVAYLGSMYRLGLLPLNEAFSVSVVSFAAQVAVILLRQQERFTKESA